MAKSKNPSARRHQTVAHPDASRRRRDDQTTRRPDDKSGTGSPKGSVSSSRRLVVSSSRRRSSVIIGGILALALVWLYLRQVLPLELNPYDEGVIAYGAEQVLEGRRPGVDYYVPYSPGAFYVVAAAFQLFGVRLIVERDVGAVLVLVAVAAGYALVIRRRDEAAATAGDVALAGVTATLAGLLLGVLWISPVTSGAFALLLLSGLAVVSRVQSERPMKAFLAGLLLGVLMLWRLDFGIGGLAAAVGTWFVLNLIGNLVVPALTPQPPLPILGEGESGRLRHRLPSPSIGRGAGGEGHPGTPVGLRQAIAGSLALVLGALVVAGPPFAALLLAGGTRAANSLFLWPLLGTQAAALPWPSLVPAPLKTAATALEQIAHITGNWPFYFPLLALALVAWRLSHWRTLTARETATGLWLLLVAVPMFLYASGRTDPAHILPLLIVSLLLAVLALNGGLAAGGSEAWRLSGLVGFVLGLCLLVWSPLDRLARIPGPEMLRRMELQGERGAGIYPVLPFGFQYERIVRAIQLQVPPGGRIFSGTPRHDVFLTNDVMLYFLAERDPATYYWCLDAGVTTTEAVQRELIRDLAGYPARAVALWTIPVNSEANAGARSTGVTLLDEYLKSHFRPVPYQPPNATARFYELLVPTEGAR